MVQYYRDLWAKRSKMLAPLTDLVGECGQTKVTTFRSHIPTKLSTSHILTKLYIHFYAGIKATL
jgi:hypothetical protein